MSAPHPFPHGSWPGLTWRVATPEEVGVARTLPERLTAWLREHPYIHGLVLIRAGMLLFEGYGQTVDLTRSFNQNQYFNVNSVTKSITSALVGIAAGEGKIALDETLPALFPAEAATIERVGAQGVRVRHLLSMSSGYKLLSADVDTFLDDTRSLTAMLGRPVEHAPGTVWAYDDLGAHLLALALERRVGMPLAQYADERLFAPLGIWRDEGGAAPWRRTRTPDEPHPYGLQDTWHDTLWSVDINGHTIGGYGLQLTIPEMARFGYLYLCGGVWNHQHVVPADYVAQSWQPQIATPRGEEYGYLWFLPGWMGVPAACAVGFGGQMIAVLPDLDVVVALNTRVVPDAPHPRLWQKDLFADLLVPAMNGSC